MKDACVFYLARARNGIEPAIRFFDSYKRHPAGLNHTLTLICKGYGDRDEAEPLLQLAAQFSPETVFVPDFGMDLRAYGHAARECKQPCLVFLNSFSEILAPNWLSKMTSALAQPGVGLVGATGSFESMLTNALGERVGARGVVQRLRLGIRIAGCRRFFLPFPNPHLRTNAFMLSRELMLQLWPGWLWIKRRAYLLENGKNSLTNKVRQRGLGVLLVDSDGNTYEPTQWPLTRTYRLGNQEKLLVADNQTRLFAESRPDRKRQLAHYAWGEQAGTSMPPP